MKTKRIVIDTNVIVSALIFSKSTTIHQYPRYQPSQWGYTWLTWLKRKKSEYPRLPLRSNVGFH